MNPEEVELSDDEIRIIMALLDGRVRDAPQLRDIGDQRIVSLRRSALHKMEKLGKWNTYLLMGAA